MADGRAQLAASCMQFYEILTNEALQKCHILLLLNKMLVYHFTKIYWLIFLELKVGTVVVKFDVVHYFIIFSSDLPGAISISELGFILRLDEITKISHHTIQILECSAKTGSNLKEIARWIQDHCKPNS